jgi:8-oxo-dGTP pyrophosphatase MutT (NUDIX family)
MYKVFFNDSLILVGSEMKKSLNRDVVQKFQNVDYDVVSQLVTRIETDSEPGSFFIFSGANDVNWTSFRKCFNEIPAAGGLVKDQNGRCLFIKRLGVWDLPKGKIEPDESPEAAAVREVEEECGIKRLNVIRQLDSTFHIYRSPFLSSPNNLVLKETKWFLMEYSGTDLPVPEVEEDIEEVAWFNMDELDAIYQNTYTSLIDFLGKVLPVI